MWLVAAYWTAQIFHPATKNVVPQTSGIAVTWSLLKGQTQTHLALLSQSCIPARFSGDFRVHSSLRDTDTWLSLEPHGNVKKYGHLGPILSDSDFIVIGVAWVLGL